ncbi:hypothetical protein LMG31506_02030 [Cupriavidus yeoncheonensis]|uniref:Lipoprotein n=1 Tax=Cupriavidus yeoncheonensis TaxID=1462994 RepID=A0A916IU41_9BURK|nr:hypothetical protein LMG31506_02030 [Cupriavidus yeoncheonensis]
MQRSCLAVLLLTLSLTGCVSVSSSDPNPPANNAGARPSSGTTVTCPQGGCY